MHLYLSHSSFPHKLEYRMMREGYPWAITEDAMVAIMEITLLY